MEESSILFFYIIFMLAVDYTLMGPEYCRIQVVSRFLNILDISALRSQFTLYVDVDDMRKSGYQAIR